MGCWARGMCAKAEKTSSLEVDDQFLNDRSKYCFLLMITRNGDIIKEVVHMFSSSIQALVF